VVVVGLVAAVAVGLGGCSAGSVGPSPVSSAAASESVAAPSERDAYIAAGAPPLDPSAFAHGEFVGAIDLQ